jgi:DNA polymerase-3 subunit delta
LYKKKEKKEHAFKLFSHDIKNEEMPSVLFLYGEEGYLIQWAVESLLKKYVNPGCISLDYVKFQDEGETLSEILDACNTFSMMSERRVVWSNEFAPLRSANAKGFTATQLVTLSVLARKNVSATAVQNPPKCAGRFVRI